MSEQWPRAEVAEAKKGMGFWKWPFLFTIQMDFIPETQALSSCWQPVLTIELCRMTSLQQTA